MVQRSVCVLMLASIFSLFFALRLDFVASATTITVPTDFPTIQAAINSAVGGDIILVRNGVYYENISVNKSVSIVGENGNATIIDGGGSSVVVSVTADNVSLSGFTIQNSSESGILVESSFSNVSGNIIAKNVLTGIYLNNSFGSLLFENIIMDNGGDGVFLVQSSNSLVFNNLVVRNNGGVRLYSSNENSISRNVVSHDLLGGVYLFYSSHNSLVENVMSYNREYGLNLDYSSNINMIGDNVIVDNLKYGLVLGSVSDNVLRNNSMTGNQFNFYTVLARSNLPDYLNDIYPSNTVDGKEIHYVIGRKDLVINSTFYPNIGYLALVNSTSITVEGLNFTGNGQALLLAFTSNITVENLHASNNTHGIQLCSSSYVTVRNCAIANNSADGITIDHSSLNNTVIDDVIANNKFGIRVVHFSINNTISRNNIIDSEKGMWIYAYCSDNMVTNNVIVGNSIGVSLERESPCKIIGNTIAGNNQGLLLGTSGNLIYHNNFVNNTVQVEASKSSNIWDLGYSSGGNYWSDYEGEDANSDGIGDVSVVIDENDVDRYPLASFWREEDEEPPAIGFPECFPKDDIQPYAEVTVYVAVTDVGSGLTNVTLSYTIDNGSSWVELRMTYNSSSESFVAVLPAQPPETLVKYKIVAFDNAGNVAIKDNSGQLFTYRVIPEFSSVFFAVLFLTTTIIVLCIVKNLTKRNM